MKKKLFLCLYLLNFLKGFAQIDDTIAGGTLSAYNIPIDGNHKYAWSSTVYAHNEINQLGYIWRISYKLADTINNFVVLNQKIYMKMVSDTVTYSSYNYAANVNSMTLVYNGTVSMNGSDWFSVTLDTPFYYDGQSSLLIYEESRSGINQSPYPVYSYTSIYHRSTYKSSNTSFPSMTGTVTNNRPDVILSFNPIFTNDVLAINGFVQGDSLGQGLYHTYFTLRNISSTQLTSTTIKWTVNGIPQTNYNWTGSVNPGDSAKNIMIGDVSLAFGSTANVKIWSDHPNGIADGAPQNDTTNFQQMLRMNGVYTIDPSNGDFTDFVHAADSLDFYGVCGPVKFVASSGVYNGQFQILNYPGRSAVNNVDFTSATADSSDVTLTFAPTSSALNYTININDVKYLRFSKLHFESTGSIYSTAIHLVNTNHLAFDHCMITGPVCSVDSVRGDLVELGYTAAIDTTTFSNDLFFHGSRGIFRYSNTASLNRGIVVDSCRFIDQFARGIMLGYVAFSRVSHCYITTNSPYAIGIEIENAAAMGGNIIEGNSIFFPQIVSSSKGMMLINVGGWCRNNMIVIHSDVWGARSLGIDIEDYPIQVLNNSIYVNSDNGWSSDLYTFNLYSQINVFNNIFMCDTCGQCTYYYTSNANLVNADHNDYFCATCPSTINSSTYGQQSISQWNASTAMDFNSFYHQPVFYSLTDLHCNDSVIENQGVPLVDVADDFDDEARDAVHPDIGADEFTYIFSLGIREPEQTVYSLFPDPASSIVHFIYPTSVDHIRIIDVYGQIVAVSPTEIINDAIDVTGLSNGVYFIQFELQDKHIITLRFIVSR